MSEAEQTGEQKAKRGKDRHFGCLQVFLILCLFGVTSILVTVFAIDKMNQGAKIKKALRDVLHPEPVPAVVPEPKIKVVEKIVEVPVEKVVEKIVEVKPPMPSNYVPWQKIDTVKLWNGIQIAHSIEAPEGERAALEREKEDAFQVQMTFSFKTPTPSQSLDELEELNPNLGAMLPGLETLLSEASVSPFFHHLYERKTERIQQKTARFDQLLSVHNLYDTDTVLEIENPETSRKALLIQSDMDVVSDGSDGDRWPFLDNYISMSDYYQPFTSYGWPKQTTKPNPLLGRMKEELEKRKERFAVPGLSIEENRFLRARIAQLEREIPDLEARSYLIAEADPFMVMSLSFLGRRDETEFGPMIGDYAVVIHEDKIYPCIVGDAGPTFKFGEASLRMAKQINENASPYSRPVSDLGVTYIVFPASREEKNSPPNLEVWRQKCQELVDEIGGLGEGYTMHEWEDLIPVKMEEWKRANDPDSLLSGGGDAEPKKEAETASSTVPETAPQPDFSTPVVADKAEEKMSEAETVDPASLPQPSFSNPVSPKAKSDTETSQ